MKTDENRRDAGSGRDPATGKFVSGNPGGPGRRPGATLSSELRRQGYPEAVAARLLQMISDPHTSDSMFLKAVKLYGDRTEGKAVSRSLVHRTAATTLPIGFFEMTPDARRRVLDDVRQRAIAGELAPGPDMLDAGDAEGDDDGEE